VNDPDEALIWSNGIGNGLPEHPWGYDDFTGVAEPRAADSAGGLVSLSFIKASLKRRRRFWLTTAVAGLLVGCGLYVTHGPGYQASTSLLLDTGPYENIASAASNEQAMAQTRTVAELAVQELGLRESAGSFLATYKVTPVTERVILITVSAKTSSQAVLNASAVATAFLKFRAQEMQTEQDLVLGSLEQQAKQEQEHLSSIDSQISQLSSQPASTSRQAQLKSLQAEQAQTTSTLFGTRQAVIGNQTNNGSATAAAVKGSVVLDAAAPLAHSRLKPLILDVAEGLVGGLFVGIFIVVIQALASDRLRRRDDVAQALGAPVKLSIGTADAKPRLSGRRGSAVRDAGVQRIAAHLARTVPRSSRGVAALAVIPVDDLRVPASSLVSLAVSCAKEGTQVVVADLCRGAPAARLLGAQDPGVRSVNTHGTRLVLAVPPREELTPAGPLEGGSASAQHSSFTEAVIAACPPPSLLLVLMTLDPALGGGHLATWASDAVAVVTAGRSSWTKIQGVGEMIRLSGTRLVSAVLVGADSTDESLGMLRTPETV